MAAAPPLWGVVLLCGAAGVSAAIGRPNVLLILTDDQGYGDLSLHGNPYLNTPQLDRFAQSAVRFDRFYVNSFCSPTRAAILTGRYPLRTGVHGVTHNREAMRPEEVTLAEALRGAGYRTGCFGKWHNGEQYPYTAPGQGFQDFFGFHNGNWNNYFNATLLRGATPEQTTGYITDVLTGEAMKFIEKNAAGPFFCYLAYNAPHAPNQVPDKYFDKFKAKGLDDTVAAYWGMCECIDDNVGRLLAHLDRLKIAGNTIVLFLTDNGGTAGVKLFNAGMSGGKTSVHEGGSRVPLFVRWPAANWTPHLAKPIVSHIDLYPTLLELCAVAPPPRPKIDGISLRPLLEGNEKSWPERVLFTHNPIDETNKFPGAVRTQRWRLVREIKGPGGGSKAKANDAGASPWQLYDMEADPGEKNDLAPGQPGCVAELSRLYDAWFQDVSRNGLRRFPIPVGYAEENPVEIHAPQAYFTAPLRFNAGPGFANDWLTSWTAVNGRLWFDLDVVQPGAYAAEIAFACPPADAGSKIRLSAGARSLEATVPAAPIKPIALPHRDEAGKERILMRQWDTLKLGRLDLPKGQIRIQLEALSKPGAQVMDFKHLRLENLSTKAADWRDIANGLPIPKEGYCDQPYIVITRDGNWLCLLTTGPGTESQKFQHVVATISADRGKTWCPLIDIEPGGGPDWRMASWVVPLITPSGRVYAFYDYDGDGVKKMPNGKPVRECLLGWYCYRYSDDNGRSWSPKRYRLPLRVTAVDRANEWGGRVQMFWGIDKPIVLGGGRGALFAFTKMGKYISDLGEGWFFRSDNILSEPDAEKIEWRLLPEGERGVRHPDFGSVQEEHNVVELNDGSLYCVYRTVQGFPGQSLSRDGGRTWSLPAPMATRPGGRVIKHNRACPMLWKTSAGKYLFWFHNNGTPDFKGRNPVWITGGVERDGTIQWAQPEILLYDPDPTILGMSYPDLIEQDGRFWVTETQKTVARVHAIDSSLLEGLWGQFENRNVARQGLALELTGEAMRKKEAAMPRLPPLDAGGLTLDFKLTPADTAAGQVLLDWRDGAGRGGVVTTAADRSLRIELSDGLRRSAWVSDPGTIQSGRTAHVTIVVDGGPHIITFIIDGALGDGGPRRTYGWGRINPELRDVNGSPTIRLSPALSLLRLYGRALRTSEAVGNFQVDAR